MALFIWSLYCIQAASLLSMPFLSTLLPLICTGFCLVSLLSSLSCFVVTLGGVARQTSTTAHGTQGFSIEASRKGGILGGVHHSFLDVVVTLRGCWED